MKYLLIVFFILYGMQHSVAQNTSVSSTVNATGNTYKNKEFIYEWSIGEMALIETMLTDKGIITHGLLQPVLPEFIITEGFVVKAINLLSPNGDGKNDEWIIEDIEKYPDNELTIFNRNGKVIYYTKNYQNNWNGHFAGKPLLEGTYYYVLKLKKDGKIGQVKGFITILN